VGYAQRVTSADKEHLCAQRTRMEIHVEENAARQLLLMAHKKQRPIVFWGPTVLDIMFQGLFKPPLFQAPRVIMR
jgi:hypothetical protein